MLNKSLKYRLIGCIIIFGGALIAVIVGYIFIRNGNSYLGAAFMCLGPVISFAAAYLVVALMSHHGHKGKPYKRKTASEEKQHVFDMLTNKDVSDYEVFEITCPHCKRRLFVAKRDFSTTMKCSECRHELDLYTFLTR